MITQQGRDPEFKASDPRVEMFQPPEGGAAQPTVQAQNCGTELMKVFGSMGMLKAEDFIMLGGDKNGNFKPGFDVTPQSIMEHMRWREFEFQEEQKRKAKQPQQPAAAPPGAP
jgi:hypothetical protein